MQKVIRLSFFSALLMIASLRLGAQCTVSNIFIQNIRNVVPGAGTCTVTFDVSFDIQNNNGNKYIFIHTWLQSQYPNYFNCVNGSPTSNGAIHAPEAADLGPSFVNIGINNNVTTPTILSTYPPDNSVPLTPVMSITRTVLPNGGATFVLQGVTVTVPVSCGTPIVLVSDVWSSQSANAQVAHCVNCGILYAAGFFTATGLVNCANLTYGATITNNTTVALSGFYRVYADINGDGYFNPAVDTLIRDTTAFAVGAGVGTTGFVSGPVPPANRDQGLFLLFTQTSGNASGASRVVYLPSTFCGPLPVTFRSFTARRANASTIALRWETSTEVNNRGFAIQRNVNGTWETIAFVNSQAPNGNSSTPLVYTYNDPSLTSDMVQYRIQQVDLDGKARFSEIRTVRGKGSESTLVYPNPSHDGTVRIVFDERDGARDVILADMSGRTIRQWKIATGNTIEAKGLVPGMYVLRIINIGTGEQTTEKVVVTGL